MPRGGKMPGAGRRKGSLGKKTIEQQMFSERLRERINEKADKWLDAIEKAAMGFSVDSGRLTPDGKSIKKTFGPNAIAWDIAMNRAFGKVTENLDLNVKGQLSLVEIINQRRKEAEEILKKRRNESK